MSTSLRCSANPLLGRPSHLRPVPHLPHLQRCEATYDKYGVRVQTVDWDARRRSRTIAEIVESGPKLKRVIAPKQIEEGMAQLEALLPGFAPSLYLMKASDWALVLLDPEPVAKRLVLLKMHYPSMDLPLVIAQRPSLLLQSSEQIEKDAAAVKKLLAKAKDLDRLLTVEPQLLSPQFLLSALVTVSKWFDGPLKQDPVEVLERDPYLIQRAQAMSQPFEPVFEDAAGNIFTQQFDYYAKRTDWQEYIDRTRWTQPK